MREIESIQTLSDGPTSTTALRTEDRVRPRSAQRGPDWPSHHLPHWEGAVQSSHTAHRRVLEWDRRLVGRSWYEATGSARYFSVAGAAAGSLRRRNAHRFPKIGAACAMGYVDVFGCHLGNELLRSCLAETRMFTSMTNDAFFITGTGRVYFGVGRRPDCIARQRPKASRDNPTGVINLLRCVAAVAHGTA